MSSRIQVDPIKCEAHGLCAELLPERISLDEWGYPLIDPDPIPATLEDLARRAVEACPTLALRLEAAKARGRAGGGPGERRPARANERGGRQPARDSRPSYRVHRSGR
ncbi:MAG: ferredoxin [Solirubrobacteraceae bacterium]